MTDLIALKLKNKKLAVIEVIKILAFLVYRVIRKLHENYIIRKLMRSTLRVILTHIIKILTATS